MDSPPFEHLRRFFERIKNVGFFERIFSWQGIVSQGYDAFGEFQQLQGLIQEKDLEIAGLVSKNRDLTQTLEYQQQQAKNLEQNLSSEQLRSQSLNEKITEKERERATIAEAQANSEDHILRLKGDMITLAAKNEDLQAKINERENIAGGLIAADEKNQQEITRLKEDLFASQARYDLQNSQFIEVQKTLAELRQKEEERLREHDSGSPNLTPSKNNWTTTGSGCRPNAMQKSTKNSRRWSRPGRSTRKWSNNPSGRSASATRLNTATRKNSPSQQKSRTMR
jgi:DNA repair exonuclease SbcCD ATPase subunit